ncbi:MAG: chromosome segregation protein SMC [Kiritimatiellia bacterium]
MYLKALEIQGFKSFADRTRLTFEPGMIAIVGPNGCGKSNVSDAIRWVLGEQRPSALRCGKMQDLIFNGTDARKPLGMVEVSLLFSDCERSLGTEYHEVTITRRAYRSGEGQYFLNKTVCRLKDIQRLFMGTGVGTTSYSVMAQGQIDAILSSRPEDRRAVFEEAAGVTKFKADRKDALHKIQQTEENLTRLTDLLRELKRQETLLQRQAEKAERAQKLRGELRAVDLYLSKKRAAELETRVADVGLRLAALGNRLLALQAEADAGTAAIAEVNVRIQTDEDVIATLSEQSAASVARHSRAQEIIQTNLARIDEYRTWAVGLEKEIAAAREQIVRAQEDPLVTPDLASLDDERETLQNLLDDAQEAYDERKASVEGAHTALQAAREGLAACDRKQLYYQQMLAKAEEGREERLLKRERLLAEHSEAARLREERVAARDAVAVEAEQYRSAATEAREALITVDEDRSFLADDRASARQRQETRHQQLAAVEAQQELLARPAIGEQPDASEQLMAADNRFALNAGDVLGSLAEALTVPKEHRRAVEVALAPWSRAVVVRSVAVVQKILKALPVLLPDASVQLLIAEGTVEGELPFGIVAQAGFEGVVARLLSAFVRVDVLPDQPPEKGAYITEDGEVLYASGDAVRMARNAAADPLTRRMIRAEMDEKRLVLQQAIAAEEIVLAELQARLDAMGMRLKDVQRTLEKAQRLADQAEGAFTAAERDAKAAEARYAAIDLRLSEMTAITWHEKDEREHARTELDAVAGEREQLTHETTQRSAQLTALEGEQEAASARLSEARFRMVSFTQQREHVLAQQRDRLARLQELEKTIASRVESVASCQGNRERLDAENARIAASLGSLEQDTAAIQEKIQTARAVRVELNAERERLETVTAVARRTLAEEQEARSKAEVEMAEARVHHQLLMARLAQEYGVLPETFADEPCATWAEDETPPDEALDVRMAEIRAELDRLGPVNLLAIEEYRTLEERYRFTKAQEEDLTKSRDELLALIRTINETSGAQFRKTFDQANVHFEAMFKRLFHGGEARLVLLENTEDPLECGIDIIARPPGKKPQTISLLSGGERTMTAVSLLFAIFLIKPAPFCLLDELDAALDDSNIGRFVEVLKDFLVHSQFLIITHNQHTIAGSDIVYGVTMPEKGVSKTLSMRLKKEA